MTPKKRRLAALIGILAVALIGDVFAARIALDLRPACERAADWVESHRGQLPTTLAAISAFPDAYRRAIGGALPPDVAAELWSEHTTNLAHRSQMSELQRNAALEIASMIRPILYERGAENDVARETLQQLLSTRLAEAFPEPEERAAFSVLGPMESPVTIGRGGILQLTERVRDLFAADAAGQLNCNCASSIDCSFDAHCVRGGCTELWTCGLGSFKCVGRCAPWFETNR